MIRHILLPLVLATSACVAVLLAVHRPPLASAADLRLLAMLLGLTLGGITLIFLMLVPVILLLRQARFSFAVSALFLVVAGGVIGKALLWFILPSLPLSAMLPGAGAALIWLAFNRDCIARAPG